MREEVESFKRQVTPILPTTTEAASELQVLAAGNEPAVVQESKDLSLATVASDNLSTEESAEVEVEKPAVVEVVIVATQHRLKPLTSVGLEKRLGKDNSTIGRNQKKGDEHFRQWSADLDPDGVAWEFRKGKPRSAQFHPLV